MSAVAKNTNVADRMIPGRRDFFESNLIISFSYRSYRISTQGGESKSHSVPNTGVTLFPSKYIGVIINLCTAKVSENIYSDFP
jgi:hypothetical protein